MIAAERTVLILLAAGRSERFGALDKLEQDFLGQPLAFHVVSALEAVPFRDRIVVRSGTELDFAARGYRVIHNGRPEIGMSNSVKLGVAAAQAGGAEAVLIALADMPNVTAAHVYRLLDAADGPDAVVASSNGVKPCPPALFGADRFDALLALEGDEGARALIAGGRHVVASDRELLDIDRPEDLERLRALP
ncbi:nucleotidyltransferase family protein [Sphingomonas sp. GB1N7]|uniref:nucleotidyltransferase family protein n=1 Tax=Parasphingomonas caseinilytica TaxID=3096158 RepID=UPI002FC98515